MFLYCYKGHMKLLDKRTIRMMYTLDTMINALKSVDVSLGNTWGSVNKITTVNEARAFKALPPVDLGTIKGFSIDRVVIDDIIEAIALDTAEDVIDDMIDPTSNDEETDMPTQDEMRMPSKRIILEDVGPQRPPESEGDRLAAFFRRSEVPAGYWSLDASPIRKRLPDESQAPDGTWFRLTLWSQIGGLVLEVMTWKTPPVQELGQHAPAQLFPALTYEPVASWLESAKCRLLEEVVNRQLIPEKFNPHQYAWLQERIGEVEHMAKVVEEMLPKLERRWVQVPYSWVELALPL